MTTLICKNCEALENIIAKKVNWFSLLSSENISLHRSLTTAREDTRNLQIKLTNLHDHSFNDQKEITKLYIETEYLKCQLNKQKIGTKKLAPLVEYQKKIQAEQLIVIENDKYLCKKQTELQINKLQDHIKVLLEELNICHKELICQTQSYLSERKLFRELSNEERLRSDMYLSSVSKESLEGVYDKIQGKFEKMLKYKDDQIKRQDDLISVLKKQQEAINCQYHKLADNKNKAAVHYKYENSKLKEELERLRNKYGKLEKRRQLEIEGFQTQIKLMNSKARKS